MLKEALRRVKSSVDNSVHSLSDRLAIEEAIRQYQKQPHIVAEGRKVIRDRMGNPVEVVMTGFPNEEALQEMPQGSGKENLPLVVHLGNDIGTHDELIRRKTILKPQTSLDRFTEISAVRIHNERGVRYFATGTPKPQIPSKRI